MRKLNKNRTFKRGTDILFCIFLACIGSPFFICAVIWIKMVSRGPVIFSQLRVGYQKKLFRIYKLRTMTFRENAEERPAKIGDERVLFGAAFIRKIRLDEMPQIINIFKGEMSLVGPRPDIQSTTRALEKTYPNYEQRFKVMPGLTGLAQIRLGYAETSRQMRGKLKIDLLYVKNWNNCLDLLILLKTIPVILTGKGSR